MTKNYIPTINISSLIKNNFETQIAFKTIKEIGWKRKKLNQYKIFSKYYRSAIIKCNHHRF